MTTLIHKPQKSASTLNMVLMQTHFLVGDVKNNANKIIRLTLEASAGGADLVVFPELALVGYPPEDLLFRAGFLAQVAVEKQKIIDVIKQQNSNICVIFGLPVVEGAKVFNAAIFISSLLDVAEQYYFKQSLPNYSVFDELRYFSPAPEQKNQQNRVIELNGHKMGLLICEDVWQPHLVEQCKQAGAELVLVLNASPFHIAKHKQRMEVLQSHAKQFSLPLAYLNLIGGQDELVFDGDSLIVNKTGKLVGRGKLFAEDKLKLQLSVQKHLTVLPPLNEQQLLKTPTTEAMVYQALVSGVRDFVHNNGFKAVVIGLSGGVDSALTLAIAVDALGAKNVDAVMMPSKYTAEISLHDADEQAKIMGVRYQVMSIADVFQQFLSTLAPSFDGAPVDTTEENIQARCRGVLLMALSNKTGRMVLTTGNKSEMAVGYATLYGDMCGGFAPIKDVCKTLVYQLCHYRNTLGAVIPERVLSRAPSAELRENQCDQDSLPDYDVLDKILALSVEQDKTIDEIVAQGIKRETVIKIIKLVQQNEHKRRQSAPGIRITQRAFGRDRRYPITSGYRRE